MSEAFRIATGEFKKLLRHPGRLREALRPRRWRQFLEILRFASRKDARWNADVSHPSIQRRAYASYDAYLQHQQGKLRHLDLASYETDYRRALRDRLESSGNLPLHASVLCLGARLGAEVRAFRDLGCFAIGIDLNPGPGNPCVVTGDFHATGFPDQSVDGVFTNSLDHAFDPDRLFTEVRRILKPGGRFIVELIRGRAEGILPDAYASVWWDRADDAVRLLEHAGFKLLNRRAFENPWPGEHLHFQAGVRATPADAPLSSP